jgi:putative transposase
MGAVLQQDLITLRCAPQSGMVARVIRTRKAQCRPRQRCESLQHASRLIGDWMDFDKHQRPAPAWVTRDGL